MHDPSPCAAVCLLAPKEQREERIQTDVSELALWELLDHEHVLREMRGCNFFILIFENIIFTDRPSENTYSISGLNDARLDGTLGSLKGARLLSALYVQWTWASAYLAPFYL
jgi:hypothetical protein